jgi:hypothetical protein
VLPARLLSLLQICAASNYGGVCFTQPLKVFIYSGEAVRDFGDFDVAAAAAAAAAGLDVAAAAAAAAGRGGSMSDNTSCSDDSMSGCCERLLPCVALLQGLELMEDSCMDKVVITPDTPDITEDNSVDDVSCDSAEESCSGGQKLAAAGEAEADSNDAAAGGMVMGSCMDLGSLVGAAEAGAVVMTAACCCCTLLAAALTMARPRFWIACRLRLRPRAWLVRDVVAAVLLLRQRWERCLLHVCNCCTLQFSARV